MGEGRGEYRILMGKPEEKMSFGTPKRRWDDIKNGASRSRMGRRVLN
jgi:hypothetical protein